MSSVTCSRGKVKFNSSLSGSQISYGQWQFSEYHALKSNQTLVHSGFQIINLNWGDIILKVHCFHCCFMKVKIISSIEKLRLADLLWVFWFVRDQIVDIRLDFQYKIQWMQSLFSLQKQSQELECCWNCFLEWTGFVWQEWWKSLQYFPNSWNPQERKQACPFVTCDNHP